MGSYVTAECTCGYERDIAIGGGMEDFETYCSFPIYCASCNNLSVTNVLDKSIRCAHCTSVDVKLYDDDSLIDEKGQAVCSWYAGGQLNRKLVLTNGNYLCPKCEGFALHFEDSGLDFD